MSQTLSRREAANRLGIGVQTLDRMATDRLIPRKYDNGQPIFQTTDVDGLITRQGPPATEATPPSRKPAMMKIAAAAEFLGMTPRAVSRLVADGRIAVHYIGPRGGMVRFTEPDLEDYLASCRVFGAKAVARQARRK